MDFFLLTIQTGVVASLNHATPYLGNPGPVQLGSC